jgi:nucleoside 2-deoxyribosyltransferase
MSSSLDSGGVWLPARCFISHSYKDLQARQRLLDSLPSTVQPVIFPPIEALSEKILRYELIRALEQCDGLIYLEGGYSDTSIWVAFERDYALRAGKPVFAFDTLSGQLRSDVTLARKAESPGEHALCGTRTSSRRRSLRR